MTSEEIVKSLRCCAEIGECEKCVIDAEASWDACRKRDAEAADLIERLEKEKAARWIPTTERLPDIEKRVLTMDKWGHISDRMLRAFTSDKAYFTPDGMDPRKDIKYWMPLPKAPGSEARKDG